MIFQTEVTDYTGDVFKNLGQHVLNTDRIAKHRAVNGSSSSFFYTDRGSDRRRKPMPANCGSTPTEIQTAMDSVLNSNRMPLNVFPGNNTSEDTVERYISYKDFIFATPHRLNAHHSWVTIVEGFKITKLLVDSSLTDLVDFAMTGTTTTTTTSTSTTSTTSTSTSSTSTTSTSTTSTTSTTSSTTSTTTTTIAPIDATLLLEDGVDFFRLQVRSAELNLDQTITPLGFGEGAVDGIDWDTIETYS